MYQENERIVSLIKEYFDMLYLADSEKVEQIFYTEAKIQSCENEEIVSIDLAAFKQRMLNRPKPKDLGEIQDGEIISLDFAASNLAHVKLKSTMLGKLFIDYLTLFKAKGKWKIISKVFHAQILQ